MTDDEKKALDKRLADFLDSERDREASGYTIANVLVKIHTFEIALRSLNDQVRGMNSRVSSLEANEDATHERLVVHGVTLAKHHTAIDALRKRARHGDDDTEMSTGSFHLAAIEQEVAALKNRRMLSERAKTDEVTWWKRTLVGWVVGGIGSVMLVVVTVLVTIAISGHR